MAENPFARFAEKTDDPQNPFAQYAARPAATPAPPADDQYRAAAREDLRRAEGTGAGRLQRQIMQGLTFGAADEIIAGAMTPFEMIRRGTINPVEAYNYAKAREDLALEQDRQRDGVVGSVAEGVAGVMSGMGAAGGGMTAARFIGPNAGLAARSGAMAADGAAYGALTGAMTNSGSERLSGALGGGLLGLGIGGAIPVVGQVASTVAAPITANIAARVNPDKFAQGQVARAVSESGRAPQQIIDDVAAAARDGQGVYTVADAMGNAGQRMLSTVARNPGQGRTAVVEFLEGRQADQGRRVAGALDDALGSSQTAASLQRIQEAARKAEANLLYGDARRQAGAVDISGAIGKADEVVRPGVNRVVSVPSNIADNTVEGVVSNAKRLLTDGRSVLSNFDDVLAAKIDIDSMIERATSRQQAALIPVRNALDDALASASAPYAKARDAYRVASEGIEAIQTGRQAAQRGRYEDTTAAFGAMSPQQQAGFRSGYGDVLTERVQGAAPGVNKARDFTSDAMRAEMPMFARPGTADQFGRRIERENTMFATRNHATQGSRTKDNFADDAAMGVSPEILRNVLSGNLLGAGRAALASGQAVVSGNTAPVRERIAELLLSRGANAQQVGQLLNDAMQSSAARRRIVDILSRGVLGGGAASADAFNIPATSAR